MEYVIKIDQGDYIQERGDYDWGRADLGTATTYETEKEAREAIKRLQVASWVKAIEEFD